MLTPSFFVISDPIFLEWKHNIRCNITTASRHRTIASTWSSMVLFLFVQFSQTLTFFKFFAILPWLLPSPVPYKWGVFFWASLNLEVGCFPYRRKTVCYMEVFPNGDINQLSTRQELKDAFYHAVSGKSKIVAVWPGQWRSDLFIIDDLEEFNTELALM